MSNETQSVRVHTLFPKPLHSALEQLAKVNAAKFRQGKTVSDILRIQAVKLLRQPENLALLRDAGVDVTPFTAK